jgi:hypothetical protein
MKSCIKCLLVDNSETRDVDRVALQENGKACFGPCEKAKANITFTENAGLCLLQVDNPQLNGA